MKPEDMPQQWYSRTYEGDEKPMACPVSMFVLHQVENALPLRGSNLACDSFISSPATPKGDPRAVHCTDLAVARPAMGGAAGPTMGGFPAENFHTKLGRAVAQAFPQVEAAMQQPWFQRTLQNPESAKPLWQELMSSPPRKTEPLISFV